MCDLFTYYPLCGRLGKKAVIVRCCCCHILRYVFFPFPFRCLKEERRKKERENAFAMSFNDLLLRALPEETRLSRRQAMSTTGNSSGERLATSASVSRPALSGSGLLDDDKLLSDDYLNWSQSKRAQLNEFERLERFEEFAAKVKASLKADEEQNKGKPKPIRTILDDPEFLEEYPEPPPPKPKIIASKENTQKSPKVPVRRTLFLDGDDNDDDDDDEEVPIKILPHTRRNSRSRNNGSSSSNGCGGGGGSSSFTVSVSNSTALEELEQLKCENALLKEENAKLKGLLKESEKFKVGAVTLSAAIRELHASLCSTSRVAYDVDTPFSLLDFVRRDGEQKSGTTTVAAAAATETTYSLSVSRKKYSNGSTKEQLPGGFTTLRMKNGDSYMSLPSGKKVFAAVDGTAVADTAEGTKEIYNRKTGHYERYTASSMHEVLFGDTSYVLEKKDVFRVGVRSLGDPVVTVEAPDGTEVVVYPNGSVTLN